MTRTDRIRIKTALDFITPRLIRRKYGYTLRQIRLAKKALLTPQKKGKYGAKTAIKTPKRKELVNWLLQSPSYRHITFKHIASFALELGLKRYGTKAIRIAFRKKGYGRQIAKRKGFSNDLVVMAHCV